MSQFLKDLQTGFKSKASFESHLGCGGDTTTSTEILREEIEQLRDESTVVPDSELSRELNEVSAVEVSLSGAIDEVNAVSQVTPANILPAVAVVNNTLTDTAKVMGVEAPAPLTVDDTTYEIDEASMEGVLDWIKQALVAFGNAVRKLGVRIRMGFNRYGNMSGVLKRRISQCYALIGRRKSAVGGNPIKLKEKYLAKLVLGNGLADDYITALKSSGEMVSTVSLAYTPVITKTTEALQSALNNAMSWRKGKDANNPLDLDVSDIVSTLDQIVKKGETYLGNVQVTMRPSKGVLPELVLMDGRPDATYVVRNLEAVNSLSTDQIKSLMMNLSGLIDQEVKGLEDMLDMIGDDIDGMLSMISDNANKALTPISQGENLVDKAFITASKVGALMSARDLQYIEQRVNAELVFMWDSISTLHDFQLERISAVIALIEESLMQD